MAVQGPAWRLIGGGFDGASSHGVPFREIPKGPKDGVNKTFYLSFTPWLGFVFLYLNGPIEDPFNSSGVVGTPEFTVSGNVITYAIAPDATDNHWCWYWKGPGSPNTSVRARGFGSMGSASTDMIDYGNSALYQLQADMSFGAWIKLSATASGEIVWRGYADSSPVSADNECFKLAPLSSGSKWDLRYGHEHGSAGGISLDFAAQLSSDKWYYAAFSRDSTAKAVTLWIGDGVTIAPITTKTYSDNPDGGAGSNNRLIIANLVGDSGFPPVALNGAVEEHYLWSRTTTLADQTMAMGGNPPTNGLVLACAMGTSPEIDSSGNGGSGIVTGTLMVAGH